MWKKISMKLKNYPARLNVIRILIEYGIGVTEDGKITIGPVEIPEVSIARAAGVDRRIVKKTVEYILQDRELRRIFTGLRPAGALLAPIAKELGYFVVEIRADPTAPGILAGAAKIAAEENISIRQAVAEDPELFPEPKLILILDKPLSGEGVNKMLKIPYVKSVTAY